MYAEASGIGGGPSALSQGLSPLEGIVVPTLGAYDLAATLLFPFVVIRLVASEKETGALALMLQSPAKFWRLDRREGNRAVVAWLVAGIAGGGATLWRGMGGHLYAPETWTVVLGHLLRGLLTIGIAAAAGALAASAASAAIIALTVTLGTWALDYVAAARGGAIAAMAAYTPSAALRVFEHGELRVATVLVLLTLAVGGLVVASIVARAGRQLRASRVGRCGRDRCSWRGCVLRSRSSREPRCERGSAQFVSAAPTKRRFARSMRRYASWCIRCRGSAARRISSGACSRSCGV